MAYPKRRVRALGFGRLTVVTDIAVSQQLWERTPDDELDGTIREIRAIIASWRRVAVRRQRRSQ
jgi:hypothetical protein